MYAWSREHGLKKTTDKNEFEEKLREMLGFAVAMGICNCQYISASGKKKWLRALMAELWALKVIDYYFK